MLTADQLAKLEAVPGRVIVGFSGGCDSHVLLHYLRENLSRDIQALHVNHNLMLEAPSWQTHCEAVCDALNVMLYSVSVLVKTQGSLETNAREARYRVFENLLEQGDVLLLAHHQDDQVETIMMNLLSGRAPLGVLGMPDARSLGEGSIERPLLSKSRIEIEQYGRDHALSWINDPSNLDTQHTRNHLRQEIIPKLKSQWPDLNTTLQRAWQTTSDHMLRIEQQAVVDFKQSSPFINVLAVPELHHLDEFRQEACLRLLLKRVGYAKLPGTRLLAEIRRVLVNNDRDSGFDLGDCYLQRFRQQISAIKKAEPQAQEVGAESGLKFSGGMLSSEIVQGRGVSLPANQLVCRTRQPGDRIEVRGQGRSLKSLFQEFGYPPHIRNLTPLVILDGVCVAIAAIPCWGLKGVTADSYKVIAGSYGCAVAWMPPGTFGSD